MECMIIKSSNAIMSHESCNHFPISVSNYILRLAIEITKFETTQYLLIVNRVNIWKVNIGCIVVDTSIEN